ncbi:MAG: hypothetical protein ACYC06_11430 [Ilumatobacteraceae bacterium]
MTSPPKDNDPSHVVPPRRDPIRRRRGIISVWTQLAKRIGYLCFGISIVAVSVGLLWRFTPLIGNIATTALVIGSVLLAPAIVLGYAVKAAERDDKLNGM